MAEELGRRLRTENERNTCSLDKILLAARAIHSSENDSFTRIPVLDELVNIFIRSRLRPRLDLPLSTSTVEGGPLFSPRQPPIIQVDGLGPTSGKTQLLYLVAARCLLGHGGGASGGDNSHTANTPGAVVWFDLRGNLSARRLLEILKAELRWKKDDVRLPENLPARVGAEVDQDDREVFLEPPEPPGPATGADGTRNHAEEAYPAVQIEAMAREALEHVHIFRPQSTLALISTLESLPSYLLSPSPSHRSQNRPLQLLIVSELSSFWWQDRHDADLDTMGILQRAPEQAEPAETARTSVPQGHNDIRLSKSAQSQTRSANTGTSTSSTSSVYTTRWRTLTRTLRNIQLQFGVPVLASDFSLSRIRNTNSRKRRAGESSHSGMLHLPPHLPAVWNSAVTVRLILKRRRRRFGLAVGAVEVLEQVAREQRAMEAKAAAEAEAKAAASSDAMDMDTSMATDTNPKPETAQDKNNIHIPSNEAFNNDTKTNPNPSPSPNPEPRRRPTTKLKSKPLPLSLESDILLNSFGTEDWSRATWDAFESWRQRGQGGQGGREGQAEQARQRRSCVLRVFGGGGDNGEGEGEDEDGNGNGKIEVLFA